MVYWDIEWDGVSNIKGTCNFPVLTSQNCSCENCLYHTPGLVSRKLNATIISLINPTCAFLIQTQLIMGLGKEK